MFSRASTKTDAKGATSLAVTLASPKGGLKTSIPSILSADLHIKGNLESGGDIQIDGAIEGDVTSRTITVSETASVKGSLAAETVRICGLVQGGVTARAVTLTRTARVLGDIAHQSLAIEAGAVFEGHARRIEANHLKAGDTLALIDGTAHDESGR